MSKSLPTPNTQGTAHHSPELLSWAVASFLDATLHKRRKEPRALQPHVLLGYMGGSARGRQVAAPRHMHSMRAEQERSGLLAPQPRPRAACLTDAPPSLAGPPADGGG